MEDKKIEIKENIEKLLSKDLKWYIIQVYNTCELSVFLL